LLQIRLNDDTASRPREEARYAKTRIRGALHCRWVQKIRYVDVRDRSLEKYKVLHECIPFLYKHMYHVQFIIQTAGLLFSPNVCMEII